jgi:hypothetical protein
MNKRQELREAFEYAFSRVEFEKIHGYMELTHWTWAGGAVPSIDELKMTVRSLWFDIADKSLEQKHTCCSTGGFLVSRTVYDTSIEVQIFFMLSVGRGSFTVD